MQAEHDSRNALEVQAMQQSPCKLVAPEDTFVHVREVEFQR